MACMAMPCTHHSQCCIRHMGRHVASHVHELSEAVQMHVVLVKRMKAGNGLETNDSAWNKKGYRSGSKGDLTSALDA